VKHDALLMDRRCEVKHDALLMYCVALSSSQVCVWRWRLGRFDGGEISLFPALPNEIE
jgi:hypothetical protein